MQPLLNYLADVEFMKENLYGHNLFPLEKLNVLEMIYRGSIGKKLYK